MKIDKKKLAAVWGDEETGGGRPVNKFCNYSIVPSKNRDNVLVFVEQVKFIPFIIGLLVTSPLLLLMLIANGLQFIMENVGDLMLKSTWLRTTYNSVNRNLCYREDAMWMREFKANKDYYLKIITEEQYNKLLEYEKEIKDDEEDLG